MVFTGTCDYDGKEREGRMRWLEGVRCRGFSVLVLSKTHVDT